MSRSPITQMPEPWLRGTNESLPPVLRSVLHALELAKEDIDRWCGDLTFEELNARPFGIEPVSFHLLHMARSLDRLLTYAEGSQLSSVQEAALESELASDYAREDVLAEWNAAFKAAGRRLHASAARDLNEPRSVGKKHLQTTLGGLIIHIGDHVQRHVGQVVTTVKVVKGSQIGS
ncbi:MAG TPA: DinB family protein [Acidisarcina sp.]